MAELSRRNLLLNAFQNDMPPPHVSSLVVHARPERLDEVTAAVGALAGAEIHGCDPRGKFIVTLETCDEGEIVARVNEMHDIPGVLSVALVFHQFA